MGKDRLQGPSQKGRVTVVMFQLEGSDDTLRDAIKVLGQGIEKLAPGAPIYRMLPPAAVHGNGAALPPGKEADPPEPEYELEEDQRDDDTTSSQDNSERTRRRRIQKAIVAVKDVDWDSEPSFREYAKQKNPENAQERFLVVAGWFKNHRNVPVISPGHIVAAFDVMDWEKPGNIPNTFAIIKNAKEWFDKGEKRNEWVLGQRGINALDRLGKGGSEA